MVEAGSLSEQNHVVSDSITTASIWITLCSLSVNGIGTHSSGEVIKLVCVSINARIFFEYESRPAKDGTYDRSQNHEQ